MPAPKGKILSIAIASGKIGYVFLIDNMLMDWGLSVRASKTPGLAKCKAQEWIDFYRPDIVVVEKTAKYSRKSIRTHSLIEAVANLCTDRKQQFIAIERQQTYPNKYDEMDALCLQFPQISGWMPDKRQPWDAETNDAIYFEALSMAVTLIEPPVNLPV